MKASLLVVNGSRDPHWRQVTILVCVPGRVDQDALS